MVETRGERQKRLAVAISEDDSNRNNEFEGDICLTLQQAERAWSIKKKQRRLERWQCRHPPFEVLPVDILPFILLFLDSPLDIYRLSMISKAFRQAIVESPQVVIRAAVFAGGKPQDTIQGIMGYVKRKSIHVPSVPRLLKLLNAHRCELGSDCCGLNLNTGLSKKLGSSTLRPFGMSICDDCIECHCSRLWRYNAWFASNERVVTHRRGEILCHPQFEKETGDQIGPILLAKDLKQITNTDFNNVKRNEVLNDKLKAIDDSQSEEKTVCAQQLVRIFDSAMTEYPRHDKAKHDLWLQKHNQKDTERKARKLEKARPVLQKLEEFLRGHEFHSIALACNWDDRFGLHTFEYGPSKAILQPLLSAPSAATKKKIRVAATEIREAYELLASNGFLGDKFPRQLGSGNQNSFFRSLKESDQTLYKYCYQKKTSRQLLASEGYQSRADPADKAFIQLVRDGEIVEALLRVMSNNDVKEAFIAKVIRLKAANHFSASKMRKLAAKVWESRSDNWRKPNSTAEYRRFYLNEKGRFILAVENAKRYLQDARTVAFLEEMGPPQGNIRDELRFSRAGAVDTVFDGYNLSVLLNGEFARLLMYHRITFQRQYVFRG